GVFGTAGFLVLAYRLRLRWLPSLLIRLVFFLLVLVAIGLGSRKPGKDGIERQILLVDVSDSVSETSGKVSQVFAQAWQAAGENREVIVFGAEVDYLFSEEWPQVDAAGSDMAAALQIAGEHLGGSDGTILIATDGQIREEKSVAASLANFSLGGVAVKFISLDAVDYPGDVFIAGVRGPDRVWPGTPFSLEITIYSQSAGNATLLITIGDQVEEIPLSLDPAFNTKVVGLKAGDPGVLEIGFRVVGEGDPFHENDQFFKSVEVLPKQEALFVTSAEKNARRLYTSLRAKGLPVTVISPSEFPRQVSELAPYPVVMIHDILAQDLDLEQMRALEYHILQQGKSAVFLGGNNSFSLGGYQHTPLEPLLPVSLTPPTRVQRVPLTFLMVLDRSGSMAGDRDSDIAPIELTREAAARAIETLRPDDYIGVLTFSSTFTWDVPLAPVGDGLILRSAQDKVSQIEAIGGTNMYLGLSEAIANLATQPTTDYLHILLMSDGVSGDGSAQEFERLVQQSREYGITISTIALGRESDPETLSAIADAGGGRFYYVLEPIDLSTVMVDESRAVQTANLQEGRTNVILGSENHPVMSGITLDAEALALESYIAVQSKSALGAEDILLSGNFGDPLLSVWQVGLGHTAAWMGDVGEEWLPNFEKWDDLGKFWFQLIQYTLPDPSIGEPDVEVTVTSQEVIVDLQLTTADTQALDSGSLRFLMPGADGRMQEVTASQVGVSRYRAVIDRPPDGAYSGVIHYATSGAAQQILVPFAVNYPKEWQVESLETGRDRIKDWTKSTAAEVIPLESGLAAESERPEMGWGFEILIGLLLVSWPVEIAVRRWWMPWRRP
ncbi:MAG: VWA domain-containing protein, partial [Anaerolineales bacterium]